MHTNELDGNRIYHEIFHLLPAAIFIIGKNEFGCLSFIDVNQAAEKQFWVDRRQVIGALLSDAIYLLRDIPFANTLLSLASEAQRKPSVVLHLSNGAYAVCVFKR
ncbi:MAG: PAS domain-containing protein [Gracilibacteraceae bacterium]|nr:PAS domain-containing protein [Gracilibacteraceae bacterium]